MRRCILYILFFIPFFSFAQLSGTYTIGTGVGEDFASISDAITELTKPSGVSGPVIFNLTDRSYNEQLDFKFAIIGASAINTITFQSITKDPTDIEISFTATSAANNFVIRINEAQHLIFKNLTFTAKGTAYPRVIVSENPRGNLKFIGNIFNGLVNAASGLEKCIVYLFASTSSQNLDNIEFSNNVFNNGLYGLFLDSFSSPKSPNLVISDNTFNSNLVAINTKDFDSPKITNNSLNNINGDGIRVIGCSNHFIVENNKISSSNSNTTGLLISGSNGTGLNYGFIVNNFIHATIQGIRIVNSDYIEIYFNSVNIENNPLTSFSSSYAISQDNNSTNLFIYNNLFVNKRQGYAYIGNSGINESNYNNLFTNGTNIGQWNAVNYGSFASFKTASSTNSASYNQSVTFNSISDLHVQSTPIPLTGIEIVPVTKDIDGDIRNLPPSIGADEYLIPLSGTYTIGSGGNFSTISNAVNALFLKGISGQVIFKILNGTYNEQINLTGNINGSSETNTVTFQSNSGNPEDVVITHAASGTSDNFVVKIDQVKHIIFKNLTFTAGGISYARILFSQNPRGYFSFINNNFNGTSIPTSVNTLVECYATSLPTNLDNVKFENNSFNEGKGMILYSNSVANSTNLIISGNMFNTQAGGITLFDFDSPKITSNSITLNSANSAIDLIRCKNNFKIEKNHISTSSNTGTGIKIDDFQGTNSTTGLIKNNFIQSTYYGIRLLNSDYVNIYHNTISIDVFPLTSLIQSAVIQLESGTSNINILNNIAVNFRDGYIYKAESGQITQSDFNNLFTTGSNIANWNSTNISDLTNFQTASGTNLNSYSVDVEFTSLSDLHFVSSPIPLIGTYISDITEDIDGETRNNPPFIGADEPVFLPLSVIVNLEGPYNGSNMNSGINSSLPEQQPYSTPIHDGSESVTNGFFDTHTNIVDWIVVELRVDQFTKVASRAGFLLGTGEIVDIDGTSPLVFYVNPNSIYYVVVHHRNHLPIMSAGFVSAN